MVTDLSAVRICTPLCTVKESPSADAKASSELLFGESVQVLREEKGWLKVRATADGYEGFVESNACHSTDHAATHWVTARATLVFEQPDIKSPVVHRVLFGSPLSLSDCDVDDKFMHLSDVGFIWANHCKKSSDVLSASLIDIAEQYYMGAPYLWGGRSSDGCDCSGLVQMLAAAKGIKIPRDSGEQENALPDDVEFKDRAANQLVYWPGHVGVLKTPDLLLHATAHSLQCCVEPLQNVVDRAGEPSSTKQLIDL